MKNGLFAAEQNRLSITTGHMFTAGGALLQLSLTLTTEGRYAPSVNTWLFRGLAQP
jgi:hypothetical protein